MFLDKKNWPPWTDGWMDGRTDKAKTYGPLTIVRRAIKNVLRARLIYKTSHEARAVNYTFNSLHVNFLFVQFLSTIHQYNCIQPKIRDDAGALRDRWGLRGGEWGAGGGGLISGFLHSPFLNCEILGLPQIVFTHYQPPR